jgi:anti-sigma-K factor RskA
MNAGQAPGEPVQPEQPFLIEDLVPAFSLGATDAEETAAVLRHAANPQIGNELASFSRLAGRLLYAAPTVQPPATLGAGLQAALAAPGAAAAARTAAKPRASAQPPAAARGAAEPRGWRWPQLAAAAAAVLLLLLNLYWLREINQLRADQEALQEELRQQTAQFTAQLDEQDWTIWEQEERLANQDAMLASLVAEAGERYVMNPVEPGSNAIAQVAWLENSNTAILRAENFPPLEKGKEYQLWLVSGDERTSGGLFTVDDLGRATIVFHPEALLDNFDGMGITPEPAGGSPGPTAPPVVRAQL